MFALKKGTDRLRQFLRYRALRKIAKNVNKPMSKRQRVLWERMLHEEPIFKKIFDRYFPAVCLKMFAVLQSRDVSEQIAEESFKVVRISKGLTPEERRNLLWDSSLQFLFYELDTIEDEWKVVPDKESVDRKQWLKSRSGRHIDGSYLRYEEIKLHNQNTMLSRKKTIAAKEKCNVE